MRGVRIFAPYSNSFKSRFTVRVSVSPFVLFWKSIWSIYQNFLDSKLDFICSIYFSWSRSLEMKVIIARLHYNSLFKSRILIPFCGSWGLAQVPKAWITHHLEKATSKKGTMISLKENPFCQTATFQFTLHTFSYW